MVRNACGLESPPTTDDARDRRARLRAARAHARRARCARVRGGRRRDRTTCSPRSSERGSLPRARRAGRVAVLDLVRARTRRFEVVFVLGLEEGAFPRRARPSPFLTTSARSRRSAGGSSDRTPSRATATSSTRRARGRSRRLVPRARGGDRRGRAARAEPVLGRGRERSSTRRTSRARRADGRSRRSPGRSSRRRASASGCARSSRSQRDGRRRRAMRSQPRTAGSAGSSARAAPSIAADARSAARPLLEPLAREDDLLGDRARALRRLLVGLVRRAPDRPEDDRRRARPDAARLGRAHGAAPLLRGAAEASSAPSA